MDLYRLALAHIPECLASLGLFMDIVGIWLMFLFGGIGGHFVEMPMDRVQPWHADPKGRRPQWASFLGLLLASAGFALQGVAQWL